MQKRVTFTEARCIARHLSQLKKMCLLMIGIGIGIALYISNQNTDLLGQFATTPNLHQVVHAFLFCIQMHAVFS